MSELIVVEQQDALSVFSTPGAIAPLLEQIKTKALDYTPDVSTDKGRKAIASQAYKVAQTKSYLDGIGKGLVDDLKDLPRRVDASRKEARDYLDALKDEVRKPLTEWEEEQERIAAEKKAADSAAALAIQVEADHEIALILNADFDRRKREEAERIERERKEHEQRIALEAAERAKAEAEQKAQAEREAAIKREEELKQKAARADSDRLAAEQREKQAIEDAARREKEAKAAAERAKVEAEQRAEAARLKAIEEERKRVEQEKQSAEAEQAKREANKAHRRTVNRAAVQALIESAGLTEEQGIAVVTAIASGKIPAVAIGY